ncbi:MAG TPA: TraR/DksA family transcriptional regulator [Bryobacteraceae bacterium]|nr:TraR/DksA family transcriptional regulator [Bryobacteraceae bacterium]
MDKQEMTNYKRMLEAKRAEIIRSRNPEKIVIERAADEMDELVLATERELAIETLTRQSGLLSQVTNALERIKDGSYGDCEECEEPISPRRLAALPWASLCIRCQEQADQRDRSGHDYRLDLPLPDAA